MNRRDMLKITGVAPIAAVGRAAWVDAADTEEKAIVLNAKDIERLAEAYTAAWNSGSPQRVAGHFAENGEIVINRGAPWRGRAAIAEIAAGFFADVPDLRLTCDAVRSAGSHVVYLWTFTGHAAKTGNPLFVHGWEEWDLDDQLLVKASRGWYDAEDYAQQVGGRGVAAER